MAYALGLRPFRKLRRQGTLRLKSERRLAWEQAAPLRVGRASSKREDGCLALRSKGDAKAFVDMCGSLRFWEREPQVKMS
jgi:hypothetical protein